MIFFKIIVFFDNFFTIVVFFSCFFVIFFCIFVFFFVFLECVGFLNVLKFFDIFWIFFWGFFLIFGIPFKVTMVTVISYQGSTRHQKLPKMGRNSIISQRHLFCLSFNFLVLLDKAWERFKDLRENHELYILYIYLFSSSLPK